MVRPFRLSQSYRNEVIGTIGLMGYWRLGEAAGTVAKDETGKTNGTYVGSPTLGSPGRLSGDPNTATKFSGTGQYVDLTGMPAGPTTAFVLSMWINQVAGGSLVALFDWAGQEATGCHLVYIAGSGGVGYQFSDGAQQDKAITEIPTVGASLHLVFMHDFAAKTFTTYDNGRFIATDSLAAFGTVVPVPAGKLANIGSLATVVPFNGTIDEVSLFNRILTGAEVANLYRIGRGF